MPRAALEDLQTATILEPNRSLLRSYAGKAFSDAGDARLANKEFDYARKLDPNDPTPWLYSALEKWQENRANEAVRELERSVELNDNRALFRSRLLLDQDLAVRSASLAKMYQSVGLEEIALSEAAQAVRYDYTSYSAHEFMAESFNALRDPTRFNLRYETVWFNELLLANTRTRDLVSPKAALTWDVSQGVTIRGIYAQSLGGVTFDESVRLADPTGGLQPGVPNRDLRG
jgi:tetratricopeptide (TPR) repeat protein